MISSNKQSERLPLRTRSLVLLPLHHGCGPCIIAFWKADAHSVYQLLFLRAVYLPLMPLDLPSCILLFLQYIVFVVSGCR